MRQFLCFIAGLILIFALNACSSSQPVTSPTNPPLAPKSESESTASTTNTPLVAVTRVPAASVMPTDTTSALAYPPPVEANSPGTSYPEPGAQQLIATAVPPTKDPNLGSVRGRLLQSNTPATGATLFLAEVMKDSNGKEVVASYDPSYSPRTDTDNDGVFIFPNVRPGKYGIVLYTVTSAYLLNYPDKQEQVLFVVEPGKQTDIGDLEYNDLPLPSK